MRRARVADAGGTGRSWVARSVEVVKSADDCGRRRSDVPHDGEAAKSVILPVGALMV